MVVGAGRGNDDKAWRAHMAITVAPGAEAIEEVSPGTGELVTPGGMVWGSMIIQGMSGEIQRTDQEIFIRWALTGGSRHIQKR